ncbi:peptidylprolyl isomerase [Dysgonomonas sp. Marseille-P4361]|uniref:peptidylprolyl isomerase n=1 Tax=Dysgonomonas sp. Marseille-P4361 TaxID=2161820 RepID=UPI000D54B144|nr:peptidylprolyl isomerase [Dysgonomonas sp. Marseille-P4361]
MIRKAGKLVLFTLFLGSSLLGKAQDSNDNVVDKIIWIVGDEAILKSDIEKSRMLILSRGGRIEGDPYCFIPEQLAVQKLFLDQAKIDSITVPMSNVNRAVAQQEKNVIDNLGSKEKAEEYLNATMTQLKEEWREEIKNNFMVEEAQKNIVGKKGALTPSEVRKYYAQLPKDSLPYIPTTVELQIITNEPVVPQSEIDKVKERLRDFTERVNNGQSFSSLAIMYSEEPGAAQTGGELGFRGRAEWVPEFSNMAFSLTDPKKVSNIVETEYGFHIIQLIERRGDLLNARHILLQPKVPAESFQKATAKMDTIVDLIHKGEITFEDATPFSFDKDTRNNNGLMVNRKGTSSNYGTPRFQMEDLSKEMALVVDTMKVGQVSAPFKIRLEKNNKEVIAIVKLKNRVDRHIANVSDDYQILKEIVEQKKQQEILAKWLQDKIKDTYIYIDKDWRNCDFQYSGWIKDEEENN